jgi:hypothetical protein
MNPEEYIDFVSTFGTMPDDYTGRCFKFHVLLLEKFPHGEGYYNNDHTITKIDGMFWDIEGAFTEDVSGFLPITKEITARGFSIEFLVAQFSEYLTPKQCKSIIKNYKK